MLCGDFTGGRRCDNDATTMGRRERTDGTGVALDYRCDYHKESRFPQYPLRHFYTHDPETLALYQISCFVSDESVYRTSDDNWVLWELIASVVRELGTKAENVPGSLAAMAADLEWGGRIRELLDLHDVFHFKIKAIAILTSWPATASFYGNNGMTRAGEKKAEPKAAPVPAAAPPELNAAEAVKRDSITGKVASVTVRGVKATPVPVPALPTEPPAAVFPSEAFRKQLHNAVASPEAHWIYGSELGPAEQRILVSLLAILRASQTWKSTDARLDASSMAALLSQCGFWQPWPTLASADDVEYRLRQIQLTWGSDVRRTYVMLLVLVKYCQHLGLHEVAEFFSTRLGLNQTFDAF